MHLRRAVWGLSLAAVLGLGSFARGAPVPTVKAFQIERVLTLADLLSTIAPNPQIVTPAILSGLVAPNPSIVFIGTIASNPNGTPFGDYSGAAAFVSTGYTTDTPPKLNNVTCVIAGATISYSSSAVGTLTL